MKWIEISKAKGIQFNKPVFLKDETSGNYYLGKMIKEEKTAAGLIKTFECAAFDPITAGEKRTDFTHVAIP